MDEKIHLDKTPTDLPQRLSFTMIPKSAAQEKIYRRNATASPLLRLPRELRNRIWGFVVGDEVVHIMSERVSRCSCVDSTDCEHSTNSNGDGYPSYKTRVKVCGCASTEKALGDRYSKWLDRMVSLDQAEREARKRKIIEGHGEDELITTWVSDEREHVELNLTPLEYQDMLDDPDSDTLRRLIGDEYLFDENYLEPSAEPAKDRDATVAAHALAAKRIHLLERALRVHPHTSCKGIRCGTSSARRPAQQLSQILLPLRTCRQIYAEASSRFWASTTFAFAIPQDFAYFMKALPAQKIPMIERLRLEVYNVWRGWWAETLRPASLPQTLRSLHFHIHEPMFFLTATTVNGLAIAFAPLKAEEVTVTTASDWGLRRLRTSEKKLGESMVADYVDGVRMLKLVLQRDLCGRELDRHAADLLLEWQSKAAAATAIAAA